MLKCTAGYRAGSNSRGLSDRLVVVHRAIALEFLGGITAAVAAWVKP